MTNLRACGLIAELLAISGAVLAARAPTGRRRRSWLPSVLIAAAFLLPLVAYVWILLLPQTVTSQLVQRDSALGVTSPLSATLASAISSRTPSCSILASLSRPGRQ